MKRIREVYTITEFSCGKVFRCMKYPERDIDCSISEFHYHAHNQIIKRETELVYANGDSWVPPIDEIIEVLSDGSGFAVIYPKSLDPAVVDEAPYPWYFDYPNNAAVYNADGSLRFQIKLPPNLSSHHYIFMFSTPLNTHPDKISVILGDSRGRPADIYHKYAIDPENPELIPTRETYRL